jgi:sirohydrochlorin cobaltochelatase
MGHIGLLLVGHGSSLPYNKELVENTARLIGERCPEYIVRYGFMNINSPTIKEALEQFRHEAIDVLVVVPVFLAKGVHILEDIPGEIGLGKGQVKGQYALNGKNIPLLYADPIGCDPLLAELMIKNAEKALRNI